MALSDRIARLERERQADLPKQYVHVETLPGMTRQEGLRLWCGPDRSKWPSERSKFLIIVNGGTIDMLVYDRLRDTPCDFMGRRSDLHFDARWKALCDVFDDYRIEIAERRNLPLLENCRLYDYEWREAADAA